MSTLPTVSDDASFSYAEEMLQRLWTTKAVRFAASRRLTQLDEASRLGIGILSLYVIAVTVVDLLARSETYERLLGLVCIVAPVLIIVLEGHQSGKRHLVRADRMHRSAQQIQGVHDRLDRAIKLRTVTNEVLETFDAEYQAILLEYAEHQDDLDYEVIRVDYPQRFPNSLPLPRGRKRRIHFARFVRIWGVPLVLILGGGVAMFVATRLLIK
jgi:hypothetical protein